MYARFVFQARTQRATLLVPILRRLFVALLALRWTQRCGTIVWEAGRSATLVLEAQSFDCAITKLGRLVTRPPQWSNSQRRRHPQGVGEEGIGRGAQVPVQCRRCRAGI